MTGILLLAVAVAWFVAALFITFFIKEQLPERFWRAPLAVLIFVALLVLPLVDELIGGRQFAELCEEARVVELDRDKAKGRSVELKQIPDPLLPNYRTIPRRNVPYVMVPIREDLWEYADAKTGEVVLRYKTFSAKGGWVIRLLGISEGSAPLTFSNYCAPQQERAVFRELDIKVIDNNPRSGRNLR